jgi:hypothetical protein
MTAIKLGRKTGRFSFAEKFSLLFSFSVLRPKTNVPKKIFVEAYGQNQDQIDLRNYFLIKNEPAYTSNK